MKIKILPKGMEIDEKMEDYVEKKINSLESFIEKSEDNFCDFRLGKNSKSKKNGKIYFAEASISTPKKKYGAKAENEDILEAIDELKDELSKKIRRHKGKKMAIMKKAGTMFKKMLSKN